MRSLGGGIQCIFLSSCIIITNSSTGLDSVGNQPIINDLDAGDVICAIKNFINFVLVANCLVKGNIIRIYCGLEDNRDQITDIYNALKVL